MAQFRINTPVETTEPKVLVEGQFPPGVHRFQLVVVNGRGQRSLPDVIDVRISPQRTLRIRKKTNR